MRFQKKTICALLLHTGLFLAAEESVAIRLQSGDFEDLDPAAAAKNNRWGSFQFQPDGWEVADAENAAGGRKALTLCNTLTIRADIPPELRGRSLELSFQGKGACSLWFWTGQDLTTLVEEQTDGKGHVTHTSAPVKPVYNNFRGWDGPAPYTYPVFSEFKIWFPPLAPETGRVTIRLFQDARFRYKIKNAPRKFHLDNIQLKAHRTPVYRKGKPVPADAIDVSFETGQWNWNKARVETVENGGKRKLFIRKGANLNLKLPLAQLKGKSLAFRYRAAGSGKLNVRLDMGRAGGAVNTLHSPEKMTAEESRHLIWFSEIRAEADSLTLQIDAKEHALLSDPELQISETPLVPFPRNLTGIPGETLPEDYLEGRFPDRNGLVDLAPLADAYTLGDYEIRRNAMTDGSLGTGTKDPVEFRFKDPVEVSEIRVTLPSPCIRILADTRGNGAYDHVIEDRQDGLPFSRWGNLREYVWFRKRLEKPLRLYGIRYIGGGSEFQILAAPEAAGPLLKKYAPAEALLPAPRLSRGEKVPDPRGKAKTPLRFGFTLEPWDFGIDRIMENYYRHKVPAPPVRKWGRWKRILRDYKKLNANFVLLFPPHTSVIPPGAKARPSSYPAPVMWPSKVWYLNQPFDLLTEFSRSCRENGITNFVIPREWLFKKEIRDGQITFAGEIAERGAHGVPVCMDEQLIQTGFNPQGLPRVSRSDTLRVREGHLKRLEEIAGYMREIKKTAREKNPEVLTFGGFVGFGYCKDRLGIASPHDAWGFQGETDVMGGDGTYFGIGDPPLGSYTPAAATAEYAALSPSRRVMATNNFNWGLQWNRKKKGYDNPLLYDEYPTAALAGGALSCYFNKAEFLNFWRYNFMDDKGGPPVRKVITGLGRMVSVLSAWGAGDAAVPKDVLILRSRTSEDWWHLKHWWIQNRPGAAAAAEKHPERAHLSLRNAKKRMEQGFTQFHWSIAQLIARSVPSEIFMMNQFSAWKDIASSYKVILLPFPYAVSAEAAAKLREAAESGVRIIALGGCGEGPVDELGEPHKGGPALRDLVADGKITVFPIDVIGTRNSAELEESFRKVLSEALAARNGPSLTLRRPGRHDVQCYMLEKSPAEKLVLLVNYCERDTAVDLGVKVPPGTYRMEICGLEDTARGRIGGKTEFTDEALKNFRVDLSRDEIMMLRIHQTGKQ